MEIINKKYLNKINSWIKCQSNANGTHTLRVHCYVCTYNYSSMLKTGNIVVKILFIYIFYCKFV